MCAVDEYTRINLPVPDDRSSGGGILLKTTLYTDALESIGHTINFIDNWFQCFGENYE